MWDPDGSAVEHLREGGRVLESHRTGGWLPVTKEDECGNAADFVRLGRDGGCFNVHLHDLDVVTVAGELLEQWFLTTAGHAPLCAKVDEHRTLGSEHFSIETKSARGGEGNPGKVEIIPRSRGFPAARRAKGWRAFRFVPSSMNSNRARWLCMPTGVGVLVFAATTRPKALALRCAMLAASLLLAQGCAELSDAEARDLELATIGTPQTDHQHLQRALIQIRQVSRLTDTERSLVLESHLNTVDDSYAQISRVLTDASGDPQPILADGITLSPGAQRVFNMRGNFIGDGDIRAVAYDVETAHTLIFTDLEDSKGFFGFLIGIVAFGAVVLLASFLAVFVVVIRSRRRRKAASASRA